MTMTDGLVAFVSAVVAIFVVLFFVMLTHDIQTPETACLIMVETACDKEMECGNGTPDLCLAYSNKTEFCQAAEQQDIENLEACTKAIDEMSCRDNTPLVCWNKYSDILLSLDKVPRQGIDE